MVAAVESWDWLGQGLATSSCMATPARLTLQRLVIGCEEHVSPIRLRPPAVGVWVWELHLSSPHRLCHPSPTLITITFTLLPGLEHLASYSSGDPRAKLPIV